MSRQQPIVRSMVRADKIPELKAFWGDSSVLADLGVAGHLFVLVLTKLQALAQVQAEPSNDDKLYVQTCWANAVVTYGRCFNRGPGRRMLQKSEVAKLGCDVAIHQELMNERNEVIAHFSYAHRDIERYAIMWVSSERRGVKSLAIIENYRPLPATMKVQRIVNHVRSLHDKKMVELRAEMEQLAALVTAKYEDELYDCLARDVVWAPKAVGKRG